MKVLFILLTLKSIILKKIITLIFCFTFLGAAFAQNGQRNNGKFKKNKDVYAKGNQRGFDKPGKGYYGGYYFTLRERNMQIAQINRNYNRRIRAVRGQVFRTWFAKKRQIRFLQGQRNQEIQMLMQKFNNPRNQFGKQGRNHRGRW